MSHITPSLRTQPLMDVPPSSDKGKEEAVSVPISLEKEPVEVAPIDTLPIEILTMIFRLATNNGKDQNSLCRMREVSRLWHQLIEGSAEDTNLYHYGLLSSYWNTLKEEIQHPFLKERISLIDRSISWIITLPDSNSCDEESTLFLDSTHFSHFQELSRELTGASRLLGFESAPYEEIQGILDTSLEQIWPCIRTQANFVGAPMPGDNAQAIRGWLNNPVHTEKIARITQLDLSWIFSTTLAPEIGIFSQLTRLSLRTTQFTSLPMSIGNLLQLTELNLSDNRLTSLPESIGKLSQLTSLELRFNQLTSLPISIGDLSQLTQLDLGHNRLISLPESVGNLFQLRTFQLSGNWLTSFPASIGNLFQLTELNLYKNRLTNLPASIGNLSRLTKLNLSDNRLTSLPASIGNLLQLTELNLSDNRLTSLPASIGNLSQLTHLRLDHYLLLFILAKDHILAKEFDVFYGPKNLSYQAMADQYLDCSSYRCQLPLASLCQEIHRGKEDEVLLSTFGNLSNKLRLQIRQTLLQHILEMWGIETWPISFLSEAALDLFAETLDLFADRADFVIAIIRVLRNDWKALSEDQRRQIYAQVAILAGQPQADAAWGEAHAEENIIRLIDAMELVTQE